MLNVNLREAKGIAILEPDGELSENDFKNAAEIIDPYIEKVGKLNGLIIHVRSFPGWDTFASFITHMKFVKEHHKRISSIAFVTDSPIGSIAEKLASHFVNAEIKNFSFGDLEASITWIQSDNNQ